MKLNLTDGDDLTSELAAAIAQARSDGGGTITIPAGKYRLSATIFPSPNLTIDARGAHITRTMPRTMLRSNPLDATTRGYNGVHHLRIRGGTWDAAGYAHPDNIFTFRHGRHALVEDAVLLDVTGYHATEFNGWQGGELRDCQIYGWRPWVAGDTYTEAVQIDHCRDTQMGAADMTTCDGITMTGCIVDSSERHDTYLRGIGSHTWDEGCWHRNLTITGNRFHTSHWSVRAAAWDGATITGNTTLTPVAGVVVSPAAPEKDRPACRNITRSDNHQTSEPFTRPPLPSTPPPPGDDTTMPLSRQTKSRAQMLELGRDILALDPGFYILQCAPWQTPSSGYHRAGSWHIWPSPSQGHAMDVNWKDPKTGSRAREHTMLLKAAWLALSRGFSITFPLTPYDNQHGTVANHCGINLHCHVDCGSYSNIGTRTPAKGGALTASVVGSALGYLAANGGKASAKPNPGGNALIKRGDRGGEVKGWQSFLNTRPNVSDTLEVDGVFGDGTERATKQWQRNNHLTADGVVGAKSKRKRNKTARAWLLKHDGRIRVGDHGTAVVYLQTYLNSRPHTRPWLVSDGAFGDQTRKALEKFQRNNHLTPDHVWGPDCRAKAKSLG